MKTRLRLLSAILLLFTSASASAGFTPIPLDAVANRELEDQDDEGLPAGWSGQGSHNSLSGFPRGQADFLGIPFEIPSAGPAAVMLRSTRLSKLPASVTIPVPGVQAQALYLFCTAIWAKPEALATVTVKYSDGATQAVPISDGDNIQDWWRGDLLPRAAVGWKGKNRMGFPIHAFLIPIRLDHPESAITSIRCDSGGKNEGVFALLGATLDSEAPRDIVPPLPQWLSVPEDPAQTWFEVPPDLDLGTPPVWSEAMSATTGGRLYAIGLTGPAAVPSLDSAAPLVSRIASMGFNAIKVGPLDGLLQAEGGDSSAALDLGKRDRLENLLAEAGKRNLKILLSLTGERTFRLRDRVAGGLMIEPRLRAFPFFDPDVRKLNIDLIRQFLDHVNPHTGRKNASDPHLAGLLATQGASLFSIDLDHLPVDTIKSLTRQWNDWLGKKYPAGELAAAWQVPGCASPFHGTESLGSRSIHFLPVFDLIYRLGRNDRRAADQIAFMMDLQTQWFRSVEEAVQATGCVAPLAGSDPGGFAFLHTADLLVQSRLPNIWAGERVETRVHRDGGSQFFNRSPLADPSPMGRAFDRVKGRGFYLTDISQSIPNDFACELVPLYASLAALQDWQGIALFGHSGASGSSAEMDWLANPALSPCVPLGHFLFVRGDLPALTKEMRLTFSEARVADPNGPPANPFFSNTPATAWTPQAPVPASANEALARKIIFEFIAGSEACANEETAAQPPADAGSEPPADTLVWDRQSARLTAATASTKFFCGGPGVASLGDWEVERKSGRGLSAWVSLDGKPLAESRRVLVLLAAPSRLKGSTYERKGNSWRMANPGALPIVMETQVTALSMPSSAASWHLQKLNSLGQKLAGARRKIAAQAGCLKVEFSNHEARAFLLEAE
ncbi:MAG: hypothetical protein WCS65_03175 [Verrucomicrobiae bacterium]